MTPRPKGRSFLCKRPWWLPNARCRDSQQLGIFAKPAAVRRNAPPIPSRRFLAFCLLLLATAGHAQPPLNYQLETDWLLDATPFQARVDADRARGRIVLTNGLIRRTISTRPNAATVGFTNLMNDASIIRSIGPEGSIGLDGITFPIGGLTGLPDHAYFTRPWLEQLHTIPNSLQYVGYSTGRIEPRLAWKQIRHHAPGVCWPPAGVHLQLDYVVPESAAVARVANREDYHGFAGVRVAVHFALYDGIPLISKWLTLQNDSDHAVNVDRFSAEELAVVEFDNPVETREGVPLAHPDSLHVETDMAFGGFTHQMANRHTVHWRPDPSFRTQVNYRYESPCRLVVEPTHGPDQTIAPGGRFETFRVFELAYDGTDRERRGLALRKMYRMIAPWVTENPLMMHMRSARPDAVRQAVDQCHDVGFEMLILSFGSGFNAENDDPTYLRLWQELAEYGRSQDVEMGCYSLLSSRRVDAASMIVSPPGQQPTHGQCPALTSTWGTAYFKKLHHLFESTGFKVFEHDGSYPGDVDVTPRPPLQKGTDDSRWVQWRVISDFYKWMRGQGVYLNVPDYYFLVGSNKCGMGYRETNWSLPRAQQLMHTRQNIFDGTWAKTPSMGWMFVPLTQYHGGGAAATVEPLDQHTDHYRGMLDSNLAFGVQACYRGPRLFDTDRTRDMVKQQVSWFKEHRDILESDVIHGRRADGRDLDWMLHVNPALPERGMLVVFNPTSHPITKVIQVPLYYTGLTESAVLQEGGSRSTNYPLDQFGRIQLPIHVPAVDWTWYVVRAPSASGA